MDEVSTRILMEFFYQELLGGCTKGASLRWAQQMLRRMSLDDLTASLNLWEP